MASSRDRAICLRKVEFSETSQILALFCRRTGVVRVIAKGAHRRTKAGASNFDGGADLLDVGDCVFIDHSSRDLSTLTEWKLIEGHLGLRTNLRALLLAQYLAEVLSLLLPERDPHPQLFDRLRVTLPALSTPAVEEQFLAMHLDILHGTGYLPDFTAIASTGGDSPIDRRLLRVAETILKLPRERSSPQRLPRLSRAQTGPLTRFLGGQIEEIVQRRLQTLKYVV